MTSSGKSLISSWLEENPNLLWQGFSTQKFRPDLVSMSECAMCDYSVLTADFLCAKQGAGSFSVRDGDTAWHLTCPVGSEKKVLINGRPSSFLGRCAGPSEGPKESFPVVGRKVFFFCLSVLLLVSNLKSHSRCSWALSCLWTFRSSWRGETHSLVKTESAINQRGVRGNGLPPYNRLRLPG